MSEKAKGCMIRLKLECYNEDGELISDIPGGGWYGFESKYTMNVAATSLTRAVNEEVAKWNESKYGSGKPPPGVMR